MVRAFLYDADGHDREVPLDEALRGKLSDHVLLWLDADSRDDPQLIDVSSKLQLDPRTLDALIAEKGDVRLHNYGTYFQLSLATPPSPDGKSKLEGEGDRRLDFVVGDRWLLTVSDGPVELFERYRAQDRAETMLGALSPTAVAASLLDWHLEAYLDAAAELEAAVDELDEQVLSAKSSGQILGRMVGLKRRVSRLRMRLGVQRGVFYGLARPDFVLVASTEAAAHYANLVGRFERAIDEVERTRDLVVGSFELFSSRTNLETNELVKTLTFVTVIVGVCAALAGLMGMNFKAAIYNTGDAGFWVVVGALLAASAGATVFARRRGWI